jgi:hypothetical protein
MRLKKNKEFIEFWLVSFLFFFIIKIITSLFIKIILKSNLDNTVVDNISNFYFTFFLSVLIAPVIETFIFFKLVLRGLVYLQKINFINKRYEFCFFVLISSFLFSVNHFYSVGYLINGLISGIMYSVIYYKSYYKKYYPFVGTVLIHSLYNLFVFCWKF